MHNHKITLSEFHSIHRKIVMIKKIKNEITRNLKINVKSFHILFNLRISEFIIKNDNSKNFIIFLFFMFKIRDIYNVKIEMRRQFFKFLISMQTLLQIFQKNNWNWNYESNINDHIIHLFFMRFTSQKLWLKNHEIFIINFTYQTNK